MDKPTQMEPVARMVLDMRDRYAKHQVARHRKWRALKKIRDGSYTDEYKRIPGRTRYKSNQAVIQIEHAKALMLKSLPVPRAISDSEEEIAAGTCDDANAALDVAAASSDSNGLASGVADDINTLGPGIVKFCVKPDGSIDAKIVHPRNLFPHPMATSLPDCEGLVEDIALPLSAARRRWPEKAKALNRAAAVGAGRLGTPGVGQHSYEAPNDYDRRSASSGESIGTDLNVRILFHEAFFKDSTVVDVMDERFEASGTTDSAGKPTKSKRFSTKTKAFKYPRGRHVIVTSLGDIIEDGDNYDPDGLFPYVKFGLHRWAHEFWSISDLELMAPTILLLDELTSVNADAAKYLAYPSIAIDPRATADRSLLVMRPGQFIPIRNPKQSIEPIRMPPMHDSIIRSIAMLGNNLQLAGQPNEQRGFRPRGDVTGQSIAAMAQLADIGPGAKQANFEADWGEFFQRLFGYMKEYWPPVKKLVVNPMANDMTTRRIFADPQDPAQVNKMSTQVTYWNRAAMRKANIRIIVEPGSGVPVDPEQEFMGIMSIFQLLVQLTGGNVGLAAKIMPISYLLAHSPLRDKQMVMSRMYDLEFKEAKAAGMQEGVAEVLQSASNEDLQAWAFGAANGNA